LEDTKTSAQLKTGDLFRSFGKGGREKEGGELLILIPSIKRREKGWRLDGDRLVTEHGSR